MMQISPELTIHFPHQTQAFDQVMAMHGEVYRELENRRTQRIKLGGKAYFLKQHFGIGWKEIFKNLFQLRLPVLSAQNEWRAVEKLHQLKIPTLSIVGYGCRGINPAKLQSFLITRELPKHVSLEDFCAAWHKIPPHFRIKQAVIQEVARIARLIHEHGLNHRDFYICHFLLDSDCYSRGIIRLYLIDLHRAQLRQKTPARWIIKDLAGLYFSSKEIGLTQRDRVRFMQAYRNGASLRSILIKERDFWQKVKERGDQLYRRHAQ